MFGGNASAFSVLPLVSFLRIPESMSRDSWSPSLKTARVPGQTMTGSARLIALRKNMRAKFSAITTEIRTALMRTGAVCRDPRQDLRA